MKVTDVANLLGSSRGGVLWFDSLKVFSCFFGICVFL